jgi:phthiodiolone/phenolphthiodiolone dimycocerosates ketoreductase
MSGRRIETALPIPMDRGFPPAMLAEVCRAVNSSGAVDFLHVADQLQSWWPPGLWQPHNVAMAAMMPDPDSNADPSAIAGYAAAAAPGVGLTLSTDAIRRGPAEMMQTMLTLAAMGDGRAALQLGAGEIKNCAPYGYVRGEGLRRYEDHLRYYDAYWKSADGAVTLDGHFWKYKNATIGAARPCRPRIWALGGGPKLIDRAFTYADGFATMVPNVIETPEAFRAFVKQARQELERRGRDPGKFDFVPWIFTLIHEDPDVIRRAFDNPVVKWMVAIFGRFNNHDWAAHGMQPAFAPDYHYAMHLLPNWITDPSEVNDVLARVTHRHCELCFYHGSPQEVAAQIQPIIEAGANVIDLIDIMGLALSLEDAQRQFGRQLEVCARIKSRNAAAA